MLEVSWPFGVVSFVRSILLHHLSLRSSSTLIFSCTRSLLDLTRSYPLFSRTFFPAGMFEKGAWLVYEVNEWLGKWMKQCGGKKNVGNDRLKNFKVDFTKGSDTGGSVGIFRFWSFKFFSLKILIFFFRISKTFISSNCIMIIIMGESNPTFGWFFFLFRHLIKCLVMIRKILELLGYFVETNYSYDTCEYLLRILWNRRFLVGI